MVKKLNLLKNSDLTRIFNILTKNHMKTYQHDLSQCNMFFVISTSYISIFTNWTGALPFQTYTVLINLHVMP